MIATTVKEQVQDKESASSARIDYRLEALVIPVSNWPAWYAE
jgi:hypothetical protein